MIGVSPVIGVLVSVGELVVKLTILELKRRNLHGETLNPSNYEFGLLDQVLTTVSKRVHTGQQELLRLVNADLWAVEDAMAGQVMRQ